MPRESRKTRASTVVRNVEIRETCIRFTGYARIFVVYTNRQRIIQGLSASFTVFVYMCHRYRQDGRLGETVNEANNISLQLLVNKLQVIIIVGIENQTTGIT